MEEKAPAWHWIMPAAAGVFSLFVGVAMLLASLGADHIGGRALGNELRLYGVSGISIGLLGLTVGLIMYGEYKKDNE